MNGVQMATAKMQLHDEIVARKTAGRYPSKKYHVLDVFSAEAEFLVFNPSIDNLSRAINERLFYVKMNGKFQRPTQPDPEYVKLLQDLVMEDLFKKRHRANAPLSREEVPLMYSGRKRTLYANAVESLRSKPLTPKDGELQAFGKIENLRCDLKKREDMVQRVIQTRGYRYNVELGRYLKKIEHQLYEDVDMMFNVKTGAPSHEKTIMKGLNAMDTALQLHNKWSRFIDPVAILLDAKRFDQHCSLLLLLLEHKVYGRYFPLRKHKKHLKWLLKMQLDNKGRGYCKDGKLKYHIGACRCSGDMNTGSGNCLIMCIMSYFFMEKIGITKYAFFDNGDDAGFIIEREDLELVQREMYDHYLKLGFVMEIEKPVDVFEEISFCQTNPVFDGVNWRMVRDPRVSCSKDALDIKEMRTVKDMVCYLDSVGKGGMSLTGGIPLVQNYYNAMLRICVENTPQNFDVSKRKVDQVGLETGFYKLGIGMHEKFRAVSDEARLSFYRAFNILPDVQIAMEQFYDKMAYTWRGANNLGPVTHTRFS